MGEVASLNLLTDHCIFQTAIVQWCMVTKLTKCKSLGFVKKVNFCFRETLENLDTSFVLNVRNLNVPTVDMCRSVLQQIHVYITTESSPTCAFDTHDL